MSEKIKIKESGIQTAIEQYLKLQENLGRLIYMKCNSGATAMPKKKGVSWIRFGKIGAPDFLIWSPLGQYLMTYFVEVKGPKGKLSDPQKEFQRHVQKLGGSYYVVRSFSELQRILNL